MPTKTLPGAVLDFILAKPPLGPWAYPAWVDLTKRAAPPWMEGQPLPAGWTETTRAQVNAFIKKYGEIKTMDKRMTFMSSKTGKKGKDDQDAAGRKALCAWIIKRFRAVKINAIVDDAIERAQLSPRKVVEVDDDDVHVLGDMDTVHRGASIAALAPELFGPEVLNGALVERKVSTFLSDLVTAMWNRWRKTFEREDEQRDTREEKIKDLEHGMEKDGASFTDARAMVALIQKQMKLLAKYRDAGAKKKLEELAEKLKDMQAVAEKKKKVADANRIPKALALALQRLATEDKAYMITTELKQIISWSKKAIDPNQAEEEDDGDLEVEDGELGIQWTEGIEEFRDLSIERAKEILGLPVVTKAGESLQTGIHLFNRECDPDGIYYPGTPEWNTLVDAKKTVPLEPRWHQYVGILKMAKRMLQQRPVLLMDEVGVGKTMQAVGLIALRAFYVNHLLENKAYPGTWAEKSTVMMGNFPTIIVTPVNLHKQWEDELRRYLRPDSFDIVPYLGTGGHATVWKMLRERSKQPDERKIILATTTAVQADADSLFNMTLKTRTAKERNIQNLDEVRENSVFGQQFGLCIMDEAHVVRRINRLYMAFQELAKKSEMVVAMTATPVINKSTDLWNIGRMMRLEPFDSSEADKQYLEMVRELNRVQRAERKEGLSNTKQMQNVARGRGVSSSAVQTEYVKTMRKWVEIMRNMYVGAVIRRTVNSKDNKDQPISGLEMYVEHNLLVELNPWEAKHLQRLAEELSKDIDGGGKPPGKEFYLNIRRTLTHPGCNPHIAGEWSPPDSLAEYGEQRAAKLDALIAVLQHHLLADGAAPYVPPDDDEEEEQTSSRDPDPRQPGAPPDKIIVYVAFPANMGLVGRILKFHGIKFVEVTGEVTATKRAAIIREFKQGGRNDPRVMILSPVGLWGLNLAEANIMIILDTLWSAQEDGQLIGRVWRHPQPKRVHVYRIIAHGTPDVFLNNISFDKSAMHAAFVGAAPALKRAFKGALDSDSEDEDIEDGEDEDEEEEDDSKGKKPEASTSRRKAAAESSGKAETSKRPRRPKKSAEVVDEIEDADELEAPPAVEPMETIEEADEEDPAPAEPPRPQPRPIRKHILEPPIDPFMFIPYYREILESELARVRPAAPAPAAARAP